MGLTKTSGGQGGFLAEHLRALARTGDAPRVLVSGSADYSMPAHALWSYQIQGAPLQLDVVDRCETPLVLSRWYAARYGATSSYSTTSRSWPCTPGCASGSSPWFVGITLSAG